MRYYNLGATEGITKGALKKKKRRVDLIRSEVL